MYNTGFKPNYWIWTRHGEVAAGVPVPAVDNVPFQVEGHTSSPVAVVATSSSNPNTTGYELLDVVQGMISDAVGVNLDFEEPQYDADEVPNEEAQRFYMFLSETNKPLFEGSILEFDTRSYRFIITCNDLVHLPISPSTAPTMYSASHEDNAVWTP